ncbi:MAG: hypothetical protein ACSW73_00200 [Spirochaetales bacterium]
MSTPLNINKLIDTDQNVYEMTCVAIKEAAILSEDKEGLEEMDNNHDKVVSVALNKVLDNEVEYTKPEEN